MSSEVVKNEQFVVRYSNSLVEVIAIGNLRKYGEGMYISEDQLDVLIETL